MTGLDPRISEALARLPDYLGSHVKVSITALAIGLAISLPLAVLATRRAGLRWPLLAFAARWTPRSCIAPWRAAKSM